MGRSGGIMTGQMQGKEMQGDDWPFGRSFVVTVHLVSDLCLLAGDCGPVSWAGNGQQAYGAVFAHRHCQRSGRRSRPAPSRRLAAIQRDATKLDGRIHALDADLSDRVDNLHDGAPPCQSPPVAAQTADPRRVSHLRSATPARGLILPVFKATCQVKSGRVAE